MHQPHAFPSIRALFVAVCLLLPGTAVSAPGDTLLIANHSGNDLVGLRFTHGTTVIPKRLDLSPNSEEEIENPGGEQELRIDLGTAMCTWPKIRVAQIKSITLCHEHDMCIILTDAENKATHHQGTCTSLLPTAGTMSAGTLDQFHPGMSMNEACTLVKHQLQPNEGGVVHTTLDYAGKSWSARLYAGNGQDPGVSHDQLEDVELRQVFTPEDLQAVRATLAKQGLTPWVADFPGISLNFTEMKNLDAVHQAAFLDACIKTLLESESGEGSILYAPSNLLSELVAGDTPQRNVQIFNLIIRRGSKMLVVDLQSYQREEIHE